MLKTFQVKMMHFFTFVLCMTCTVLGFFSRGMYIKECAIAFVAAAAFVAIEYGVGAIIRGARINGYRRETVEHELAAQRKLIEKAKRHPKVALCRLILLAVTDRIRAIVAYICLLIMPLTLSGMLSGAEYSPYLCALCAALNLPLCVFAGWILVYLFPPVEPEESVLARFSVRIAPVIKPEIYDMIREALGSVDALANYCGDREIRYTANPQPTVTFNTDLLWLLTRDEAIAYIRYLRDITKTPEKAAIGKYDKIMAPWELCWVCAENIDWAFVGRDFATCVCDRALIFGPRLKEAIVKGYSESAARLAAAASKDKSALVSAIAKINMANAYDRKSELYEYYESCCTLGAGCLSVRKDRIENVIDFFEKNPDKWIEAAKRYNYEKFERDTYVNDLPLVMQACGIDKIAINFPSRISYASDKDKKYYASVTESRTNGLYGLKKINVSRLKCLFSNPNALIYAFEHEGGLENPDKTALTAEALAPVLYGYLDLNNLKEAEKVCDYVISHDDGSENCSLFLYKKAHFLLLRDDPDGVALMERVITDGGFKYLYDGITELYGYYIANGQKKAAEEFVEKFMPFFEKEKKYRLHTKVLMKGDVYEAADHDPALAEKIKDSMPDCLLDKLEAVYAVKKKNAVYDCTYILPDYEQKIAVPDRSKIYDAIEYILETKKETYRVIDFETIDNNDKAKIAELEGAKIISRSDK